MFTAEERQLFRYHNGEREVFGDPLRIWRRLNNHLEGKGRETWEAAAQEANLLEADRAQEKIYRAAVVAFDLVPLDPDTGAGCTEDHVKEVLDSFLKWIEQKKSEAENSPTS